MFASLLGAVLVAALGFSQARADKIDDLLAGKPIAEDAAPTSEPQTAAPQAVESQVTTSDFSDAPIVGSGQHDLAHPSGLDLSSLRHSSTPEPLAVDGDDHNAASPASTFSVVPEPSAIALAALALGYFFLFFRRRYAV